MPGNLEKKKIEIKKELDDQPNVFVDTRNDVIKKLTLAREFSETYMAALTKSFGGHNIPSLCQLLGKQRALLMGYVADNMRSFDLPSTESVNSALILTEPNTSVFGYSCSDIEENNIILLSNTSTDTQTITINSSTTNTFSVYVGDYYLIRYRETGELVAIDDKKQKAYETPDEDRVFGNAVAYGSSIESEAEANTWNYEFAKCNVASISVLNAGSNTELKIITLADHLTTGSNTEYTPGGPLLGQKFYLKKHSAKVDDYTVTGTVTFDDLVVTGLSDEDIELVRFGDTISGTGIPANTTIAAVQSSLNQLRLSTNAISSGSDLTLSLGHIPLGHNTHDIFAQIEVTAEGLVKNENWSSVGDDDGYYGATHHGADDILMANTSEFQALLGYFDPNSNADGLIASSRGDISSDGKETGGTTSQSGGAIGTVYPQTENLPFKPANGGTSKAAETKDGVLVGTQPSGLTDKDIWAGRHVHWMKDKTSVGPAPAYDAIAEDEYQYLVDNATKFFYMVDPLSQSSVGANPASAGASAYTYQDGHNLPNTTEPRGAASSTNLTTAMNHVHGETSGRAVSSTSGGDTTTQIPAEPQILNMSAANTSSGPSSTNTAARNAAPTPSKHPFNDTDFTAFSATINGTGPAPTNVAGSAEFYGISAANNILYKLTYVDTVSGSYSYSSGPPEAPSPSSTLSLTHSITATQLEFACAYNRAQHLLASEDFTFTKSKLTNSDVLAVNTTSYDPIVTSTGTANSGSGISDADFYNNVVAFNSNTTTLEAHQARFVSNNFTVETTALAPSSANFKFRGAIPSGERNANAAITEYSRAYGDTSTAGTFLYWQAQLGTMKGYVTARIAELDTRIGVASYTGSPTSGRKNPPAVKVSSIPSANTFKLNNPSSNAMAYIPYGRSIYDSINHALGQHVDVIGGVMRDIQSLTDLVENVKKARNKYEIFSGREKEYTL